jgi:RNA polymerase sigma-70 factor (ECF subfamily)
MGTTGNHDADEHNLLQRARQGDEQALTDLFTNYRSRLKRMVKLRLDPRVRGRVDASDIVQEAYLESSKKLADYFGEPALPFYLWLRLLTGQKLALAHRQHLGVQARAAGREVSLYQGALPQASSAALAAQLLGKLTTPSQAAMKAELKIRIQEALNSMDAIDREVLTENLEYDWEGRRHFNSRAISWQY